MSGPDEFHIEDLKKIREKALDTLRDAKTASDITKNLSTEQLGTGIGLIIGGSLCAAAAAYVNIILIPVAVVIGVVGGALIGARISRSETTKSLEIASQQNEFALQAHNTVSDLRRKDIEELDRLIEKSSNYGDPYIAMLKAKQIALATSSTQDLLGYYNIRNGLPNQSIDQHVQIGPTSDEMSAALNATINAGSKQATIAHNPNPLP